MIQQAVLVEKVINCNEWTVIFSVFKKLETLTFFYFLRKGEVSENHARRLADGQAADAH